MTREPKPEPIPITDNELLMRFARHRDEDAFRQLVERYAGLVTGVCRQVLGNANDAEDAFQATFLILARRAARLLDSQSVAGWLHKVAYRAALRAARQRARPRQAMQTLDPASDDDVLADIQQRDAIEILHAEIARLPRRYRDALVLCHLEGLSRQQAASAMDCTEASLKALLARGRKQLRYRMLRRGVALSAAVALSHQFSAKAAAAPTEWVDATVDLCLSHQASGYAWPEVPSSVKNLVSHTEKTTMISMVSKPAAVAALSLVCLAAPLVILAQTQDPAATADGTDAFVIEGVNPIYVPQRSVSVSQPQTAAANPIAQQDEPPTVPPPPVIAGPAAPPAPVAPPQAIDPNAAPAPLAGPAVRPPVPAQAPREPVYMPFLRDKADVELELDEQKTRREYFALRMRGLEQMAAAKQRSAESGDAENLMEARAEATLFEADAMLARAEMLAVERKILSLEKELAALKAAPVEPDAAAPAIPSTPAAPAPGVSR